MIPDEPVLHKNIITEEERILLKDNALNLLNTGVLQVNHSTPGDYRNFISYFDTKLISSLHKEIYNRIIGILKLENATIDPMLGLIVSVIKPGGHIHKHRDPYSYFPHTKHLQDTKRNVRFNVMVDRGEDISYNPIINDEVFIVNKNDGWCFNASKITHNTEIISGPENRIVYQFGFCVDAI